MDLYVAYCVCTYIIYILYSHPEVDRTGGYRRNLVGFVQRDLLKDGCISSAYVEPLDSEPFELLLVL